ncbi:hypothetical protein DERP_005436 [Dermatophagoides pteronyssinus]|uniref:Uncharacterized protein n=1 Tax=Dermatophagoides pteronyssinus TaxID=6956 RepID=A0ABQ8JML8_DERPT|nr:hypothetical protein DERP_005436 [Dermatophagoides pteronyssinus]
MEKSNDINNAESTLMVKSNYFQLKFLPINIYKYNVQITPTIRHENEIINVVKKYIKQNVLLSECYYENGYIYSRSLIISDQIRNNISKKLINTGIFVQNEYSFPNDRISVIVGFGFSIIPMPEPLILISRQVITFDGKIQIYDYKLFSEEADKVFSNELNCGPVKEFEFFRKCCEEIENCVESFGIKINSYETNGTLLFIQKLFQILRINHSSGNHLRQ